MEKSWGLLDGAEYRRITEECIAKVIRPRFENKLHRRWISIQPLSIDKETEQLIGALTHGP
ncbi:MAG: hypothetical protein IPJ88_15555 [Myxococcales bacterium]|nr:MAG: hypothetical protein IPJ88_15555 [Myxococcales bacterium]